MKTEVCGCDEPPENHRAESVAFPRLHKAAKHRSAHLSRPQLHCGGSVQRKAAILHLLSSKQQPDPVGDQPVNMVEHLAATEPEVSLRSWWRPKPELEEEGRLDLDSSGGLRDQIQVKDHVAGRGNMQPFARLSNLRCDHMSLCRIHDLLPLRPNTHDFLVICQCCHSTAANRGTRFDPEGKCPPPHSQMQK